MGFDEDAKQWDNAMRINRAKQVADRIYSEIDSTREYSAMEFGCGTGLVSFNLQDKLKKITLIDSSMGMIEELNKKINKYEVKNMVAIKVDITEENSLDMKYDLIYNSMVLHHIPDTRAIIKDFYKLLNGEGLLCIVDLDKEDGRFHKKYPDFGGHNGFEQEELKKLMLEAGFKDVKSESFYFDEKVVDDERIAYSLFIIKGRK